MRGFTTTEIFNFVWEAIKLSPLSEVIPTIYADHYPTQGGSGKPLPKEFIVVNSLSNAVGDMQVATLNVNIYVHDQTPTINRQEQRYPDRLRLMELTQIAFDSLRGYPTDGRWFFDVSNETLISEDAIPYTLSNIKITFRKY